MVDKEYGVVNIGSLKDFKNIFIIKLGEELQEYPESGSVEELVDLVKVVYALLNCQGVSWESRECMTKIFNYY